MLRVAWGISAAGIWLVSTLASFPIVLIGTFLRGFGGGIVWVFATQLLLKLVPGDIRGRIFATEYMIFTLLSAIGAAGVGWSLDGLFTMTQVMQLMGVLIFVPALLWSLWTINHARQKTASGMAD